MRVLTDPLGWFTLEVPEGWDRQTEDCVTQLRRPEGAGTLYLSGGRRAGGRQAGFGGADFLARFLRSLGLEIEETAIENSQGTGCRIYYYERSDAQAHWRYWSVTDDETALLISYTCPPGDAGAEAAEVDGMVRSVRLYHSAPTH
jgi:hypothetical protein